MYPAGLKQIVVGRSRPIGVRWLLAGNVSALTEARFHKSAKLGEVLCARSDDPQIARWKWEKGLFGRIGYVSLDLRVNGVSQVTGLLRVEPRKLSLEDYRGLLDEIARLAYIIIYDLRESTFEQLDLVEPKEIPQSGIEWLEKINEILTKLELVLHEIDRQPHVRLFSREERCFSWEVRRPGKALLQQLLFVQSPEFASDQQLTLGTLTSFPIGRTPVRLPDEIHEVDTNCYENRLIMRNILPLSTPVDGP
jgi:hypothetical protein